MAKRRKAAIVVLATLLLGLVQSQISENEIGDQFGLTAYGEPCVDECTNRGFSYAWCHKEPSRNGTWIDRDYCSPSPGVTRYGELCLDTCARPLGQPFFKCTTKVTKRGDWDFCSPFTADLVCAWSTWGPWSECSNQCGTKSTKTRRRRMEEVGSNGRVARCSGEIEQSIKSCQGPPCPDARPLDCSWGSWGSWSTCSVTCGRGGSQTRKRGIATPSSEDGQPCKEQDSIQTILCGREESCPEEKEEDLEEDDNMEKKYLGEFTNYFHGISGSIYSMGNQRLLIEDFKYDGSGPDAYFWVGIQDSKPSDDGILLAHPFRGKFFNYDDRDAPILKRFNGDAKIVLTLPPQVKVQDLKWISVWCRRFSINFGDFIFPKFQENINGDLEENDADNDLSFPTLFLDTVMTTESILHSIPEAPRSINGQNKVENNNIISNSDKDSDDLQDKIEEILLKQPAPVEEDDQNSRGILAKDQDEPQPFTVVRVSSSVSQIRPNNVQSLEDEDQEGSVTDNLVESTTEIFSSSTLAPRRARPPFLRPIAKFPDIKIPALETSTQKEESSFKITSLFNRPRKPINAIFGSRDRTTTISTTTTTTTTTTTEFIETTIPAETTSIGSLLDKLSPVQVDPGVANFARIPVTKLVEETEEEIFEEDTRESATFAPNAVTISAINNEGSTRLLEVVRITLPEDEPNTVEEGSNVESDNAGNTRQLEIVQITRPPGFASQTEELELNTTEGSEAFSSTTTEEEISSVSELTGTTEEVSTRISTTEDPVVPTSESKLEDPEPTPEELERKQNGRASSRFKGLNRIQLLFPKRKPFLPGTNRISRIRSTESPEVTSETPLTTPIEDIILPGFGARSTQSPFTTPTPRGPPAILDTEERTTTEQSRLLSLFKARGTRGPFTFRNTIRTTRAPIHILARSSTAIPEVSGSTFTLVTSTQSTPEFGFEQDPDLVLKSTTIRPTDDQRAKVMKDLMKDDESTKVITQFYPDYEYPEEEVESQTETDRANSENNNAINELANNRPKFSISPKFRSTTSIPLPDFDYEDEDIDIPAEPQVTPIPSIVLVSTIFNSPDNDYNPCSIPDSCGPNAICTTWNSDPVCTCPSGFSGIPRDGVPDPSHGCVRTPQRCSADDASTCPRSQSCVRDLCLPSCAADSECALGERCVNSTCTKICFYDAHCLAGEFCEKEDDVTSSNGVCLAGCRRDTNCPFGQVCQVPDGQGRGRCENGCHFNNDCTLGTACINGNCTDPCIGFTECGASAICEAVSHSATCKCPEGTRELNSPYVACVPADMDLSSISCLRDSDCSAGLTCQDWQCRSS